VGAASAQIAATPDAWKPEQAKAKTAAYVAEQVAVQQTKPKGVDIARALKLAQMVRPDEPTVTNQLAFHVGPGARADVYREVLDFRPDEPIANYYLAQSLSADGYVHLALPYYKAAADKRPGDAPVQYNAAMNAFYAEDNAACVAYFTRAFAIGLSGDDAEQAHLKRGECHARAGNKKEAKADFDAAPGNTGAYSSRMFRDGVYDGCRGGSLDGKVKEAAKIADNWKAYEGYRDLTRVLVCDPKHVGALTERLKIEDTDNNLKRHALVHRIQLQTIKDGGSTDAARMKTLQQPSAAEMLAQGQAIDMTNDTGGEKRMRAAYLASRVLMLEPDNTQALVLRARAIVNLGVGPLSAQAWDDATRALQSDPKLANAYFVRAILFVRGNGLKEAAGELTAAIAIDPNDMRFYAQRGDAYAQLGQNEPAVSDLTRFLGANPKDIPALQGRALANYNLKKYDAALADLEAAYQVDKKNIRVRASMVRVLDAMGRKADADAIHIVALAENEAEAKANTYLASRATPDLAAKAGNVKEGQAFAARDKRAKDTFQAFVNEYSPAEYSYDNLVRKMGLVKEGDTAEERKQLNDMRDTAKYADEHLKAAWRIGTAFIDSDDAAGLSEEMLSKLAAYMVHVETMQKDMAKIMDALF
jgi:tetratricopeptide (TPR) repeat protein